MHCYDRFSAFRGQLRGSSSWYSRPPRTVTYPHPHCWIKFVAFSLIFEVLVTIRLQSGFRHYFRTFIPIVFDESSTDSD